MNRVIFPVGEGNIAIRIKDQHGSGFTTVVIDQVQQATVPEKTIYWLRVIDVNGRENHDAFDHLYEALDSLTGIVKTLTKEGP